MHDQDATQAIGSPLEGRSSEEWRAALGVASNAGGQGMVPVQGHALLEVERSRLGLKRQLRLAIRQWDSWKAYALELHARLLRHEPAPSRMVLNAPSDDPAGDRTVDQARGDEVRPGSVSKASASEEGRYTRCWCRACEKAERSASGGLTPFVGVRMIVCPVCGDKRCVHAHSHAAPCAKDDLYAHNAWVERILERVIPSGASDRAEPTDAVALGEWARPAGSGGGREKR